MRAEVRDWAARDLPDELRGRDDFESLLRIDRLLSAAGLLGVTWPVAYGGRDASPAVDAVVTEELGHVGVGRAPPPAPPRVQRRPPPPQGPPPDPPPHPRAHVARLPIH
jgi:alkylation response protein AidB-like acyl-CoA dehydrogenase